MDTDSVKDSTRLVAKPSGIYRCDMRIVDCFGNLIEKIMSNTQLN